MKHLLYLFLACISCTAFAQNNAKQNGLSSIKEQTILAQLRFLSSDYFEGRDVIGKGGVLAATYIASEFEAAGLLPAGDYNPNGTRSYLQKIPMIKTSQGDNQSLEIISNGSLKEKFALNTDYFIAMPRVSTELSAEVVFIGYGVIDPKTNRNDLNGVDIKGKIAVRIKEIPKEIKSPQEEYKNWVIGKKAAENELKDRGALALIEICQYEDLIKLTNRYAENVSYYPSERISSSNSYRESVAEKAIKNNLIIISVSPRFAASLLSGSGINIEAFEKNTVSKSSVIRDKKITFLSEIVSKPDIAYNVLGAIKGDDSTINTVIGAHYDHMGMNGNFIWNGADDNASGTVAIIALANAFKATKETPRGNTIFAAWTGEEIGFVGSSYFVNNFNDGFIKANINFDMIAREAKDGSNEISIRHASSHELMVDYAQSNIDNFKIDLKIVREPLTLGNGGSTDFAPFSRKHIPFISLKTGHREDYHRHSDEFSKIDKDIFYNAVKMSFLTSWDIVNKPLDYVK